MTDKQRDVFEHVSAVMETGEARLYNQVNSSFNWLLGTLFAANGGAVVALVSREAPVALMPLGLFAAGVVCSLFMGFANAAYAAKAIMPMTDLRMTLALLEADEASIEQLQDKMKALNDTTWLKWPMYGSGVLSLIFLIGGMIAFAGML